MTQKNYGHTNEEVSRILQTQELIAAYAGSSMRLCRSMTSVDRLFQRLYINNLPAIMAHREQN